MTRKPLHRRIHRYALTLYALVGGLLFPTSAWPQNAPFWDNYPRIIETSDLATALSYHATIGMNHAHADPGWGLYGQKIGAHVANMKSECGVVSCLDGALKAPFDILADKFRGFRGVAYDLKRQPDKVLKAVEAVAPHMVFNALTGSNPDTNIPVSLWMHRGATGFFSQEVFDKYYWPTLKWATEKIWETGHQTIYYAEGKWGKNLKSFRELPDKSIIFHCDKDDIYEVQIGRAHV